MPVKKRKKSAMQMDISIGGTGLTAKALLAKHLAVMQKSGLTLTESLAIIEESATGRMKKIVRGIKRSVESGNSLSDSFARYPKVFPGVFVSAIYAGEASGTLPENLENLAEQMQKEKELMSKIKGAMLYPIVILIAAFALGMAMSFLVLPKIIPLFEGLKTDLPATTRGLIAFSHFVDAHGVALFWGILAFVILFTWTIRQTFSHPVTHWIALRTPIIKKIVHSANLARFSRLLGTMMKSGLNIDEALEVTRDSLGNYYYKKSLTRVSIRVGKGKKLSEGLEDYKKLYPVMVSKMVMVGEESGNLEETLEYLSHFYEVEVDNATKSLSTAIEPVLLMVIGLIVGFLALSIITPIYNITGNIRR